MNRLVVALLAGASACVVSAAAVGQNIRESAAIASSDVLSQISMFSYREGPKSDLFLRGTPIAANAEGSVEVEFEDGNAQISAKVEKLPPPGSLGPYTTYVLWALTPDGRAANQGVLANYESDEGELNTSYGGSQFALIVTAEPHFAVAVPSTMVALYNVADDVQGEATKVSTLTERADYSDLATIAIDEDTNPAELVQARYAVAIAAAAGAERFAPAAYGAARDKLANAVEAQSGDRDQRKTVPVVAREAVIVGEDARRAATIAGERAKAEADAAVAAETAARAAEEAARDDLINRLNAALPTRETERGLISEIGGVQFATGTSELNPEARESLSRFVGVVASYPDLRFNVEGHTDSTGDVAKNNELSLSRANAVRDYLVGQGVAASRVDVAGLGSSSPIADNGTAEGRTRNRRVEIVLSGGLLSSR